MPEYEGGDKRLKAGCGMPIFDHSFLKSWVTHGDGYHGANLANKLRAASIIELLLPQLRKDRSWPMSAMLAQTTPGPKQTVNGRQRARSQAEALETSLRAYTARLPTPRRRPAKQPETSEHPRRSCLGSHALRRSMDKSRRADCAHLCPTEVRRPATRRRDTQVNQAIASNSSRSVSGRMH